MSRAYAIAGKEDNFEYYHYPTYTNASLRSDIEELPKGVDRDSYFKLVNVEANMHYFKEELVIPWLKKILKSED